MLFNSYNLSQQPVHTLENQSYSCSIIFQSSEPTIQPPSRLKIVWREYSTTEKSHHKNGWDEWDTDALGKQKTLRELHLGSILGHWFPTCELFEATWVGRGVYLKPLANYRSWRWTLNWRGLTVIISLSINWAERGWFCIKRWLERVPFVT